MGGSSQLTLEHDIDRSVPIGGYTEDIPLPLGSWTLEDGTTIPAVGAGIVGMAQIDSGGGGVSTVIQWDDTADNNDIIRNDWCLPGQFKHRGNLEPHEARYEPILKLMVLARLKDGTGAASPNADLALQCDPAWLHIGDATISTLTTAVSNTVGATDYTDSQLNGFAWYTFDLVAAMSTAQKNAISPGDAFAFRLHPQEAIGTNLFLEVMAARVRIGRHASLATVSDR